MNFSSGEHAIIYPENGINGLISGSTTGGNFALHTAVSEAEYLAVEQVRGSFTGSMGFDRLVTLNQVHGEIIHGITAENLDSYTANPLIDGDGLITDCGDVLLGILTADCVPVFFASPGGVIGIAHAGWKGLFAGIHLRMLDLFRDTYSVEPGELRVWFGPNIRACCYEVGKELVDKFIDSGKNPVYYTRNGRFYFDLEGTITAELVSNGVSAVNIASPGLCTYESSTPRFYSYRRGDVIPRTLSFIGISGK
ncbi:MAG: peptidoglycan editing factor PgeF [Brevinematales bacterium]|nr:peptidoglycan editing factor PgeF [Brevinematales bacterium]